MAQPLSPWLLVDRAGKNVRLPATMIFLGREDCDITIQVSYKHLHAGLKIINSLSRCGSEVKQNPKYHPKSKAGVLILVGFIWAKLHGSVPNSFLRKKNF